MQELKQMQLTTTAIPASPEPSPGPQLRNNNHHPGAGGPSTCSGIGHMLKSVISNPIITSIRSVTP